MIRAFLIALLGAIIGGALVWILQGHTFQLIPGNMSYADLAATMLGAAGILLTALGLVIGILGLWGYAQFRTTVENAAVEHVKTSVAEGDLKLLVTNVSETFIAGELDKGRLRKILEDRIDEVLVQGPAARAREEAPLAANEEEFEEGSDDDQP